MCKKVTTMMQFFIIIVFLAGNPELGYTQQEEGFDTIDTVISKIYEAVSFEPGKAPNWKLMKELFLPGGTLMPPAPQNASPTFMIVDDFIARFEANRTNSEFGKKGFNERSVSNIIEMYGNIAHVFSTYESRYTKDDKKPFVRGINSIQLVYNKGRWWVSTIIWDSERPDNPIPSKYLK